jgi:CubicO group peptidase (beta-lactamase class C family)
VLRPRPVMSLPLLLLTVTPLSAQGVASRIDALVRSYVDAGRFNGSILVANHGKVLYRKGFGFANAEWKIPNSPTTRFRIGSVTKQFTAMIVMQLVDEGKLRLDATIGDYLPEYPAGPGRAITIHQLLTHTSGLHNYTSLPRFFPELSRDPHTPAQLLSLFDSLPLDFAPGSSWRYSNSGFITLGAIIERVDGRPYDVALRQRILEPLGLKDTGYEWNAPLIPNRADGYTRGFDGDEHANYIDMSTPYAAGGMYSTIEDLYRWDQALTARKLLSPASYERYLAPHVTIRPGLQYGYGWLHSRVNRGPGRDSAEAIGHNGGIPGFAACNYTIPADGIAIIWLDNTTTQEGELQDRIADLLYGRTAPPAPVSIARTIYPIILRQGADSATARYHLLKRQAPGRYDFSEPDMNLLGYHLLKRGRAADAVKVFALNTENYPESSNAYDSLGEALLAAGDTTRAITNYRRSLDLDAGNQNAARILQQLGSH